MTGTRSRAWWIASTVATASIMLTVAGAALLILNGQGVLSDFNPEVIVVGSLYAAIGWLIATRMPANRIGWVILAGSIFWAAAFLTDQYAWFAVVTRPGLLPWGVGAAWVGSWVWIPGTGLIMTGMPLLFPGGRLRSRRWSPLLVVVVAGVITATVAQAIGLWPQGDATAYVQQELNASLRPDLIGAVSAIGQEVTFLGPLAATAAVVLRLRDARGIERLQMRWFAYAMAVTAVTLLLDVLGAPAGGWSIHPGIVGIALIPVALGMAILRYRLYEIDRIISRTISWALTTGVIVAVFAGIVIGLERVLAQVTGGNTVSVAGSTLVAAAIFQPLRRRVQRAVDRRFNRSRYDAQRTVDGFAERLRNEVDLATLRSALVRTADDAVRPINSSVWLRAKAEAGE